MQVSTFTRLMGGSFAALFLFVGAAANAGDGFDGGEFFLNKRFFDRPDLLNFDPRTGTETFDSFYFTFSTMGETYTTTVVYYDGYQLECFDDPNDNKMLIDNILCFRAGHRRPNASDVYDASYLEFYAYSYDDDFIDIAQAAAFGLWGSEVFVQGYFRVMTDDGAEVFGSYFADIPDKLKRTRKKIKFTQTAWVDVGAVVFFDFGDVEPSLEPIAFADGWFQGCEFTGSAKGEAFEEGKSDNAMFPRVKQGTLEKGKGKLECDKDATEEITLKLRADAGDDATTAEQIWENALDKLGDKDKLKVDVNKKGTEDVSEKFDGDIFDFPLPDGDGPDIRL